MKPKYDLTISSLQLFAEEAAEIAEAAETAQAEAPAADAAAEEAAPVRPEPEQPAPAPQGILSLLARKYGIDAADTDALEQALREETEGGQLDPDAMQQLDRGAARIYGTWMEQAARTGEIYPDFNLKAEIRNPFFLHLLRSSVDVKTAYEVVHKDEIIPAAMQYAARTVEQKLASSLRSSASRPAENGMNSQGAVMLGSDVSRLSRKDYAEICRRVERGERVSFG